MKKIIIGVSSLLMTFSIVEAQAQTAGRAAEAAANTARGAEAAAAGSRTAINAGSRGTTLGTEGATAAAGTVRGSTDTRANTGSQLGSQGARANGSRAAGTQSNLATGSRTAVQTSSGPTCFAGKKTALACDKVTDATQQRLIADMINASEDGRGLEGRDAMAQVWEQSMGAQAQDKLAELELSSSRQVVDALFNNGCLVSK